MSVKLWFKPNNESHVFILIDEIMGNVTYKI